MTLLFGQHPTGGMADGQYPLHARVGSVGDLIPGPLPLVSGASGRGSPRRKILMRRQEILAESPEVDEDLLLGLAAFLLIETEN
jgi:hypothetical protein